MPRQRRGIRGDVGIAPYGREQGVRLHIGRVGQSPAPTHVYRTCTLPLPCHSEPVLTLAWESVPRARRRGIPPPPSARDCHFRADRAARPYTRSDVPCERPLPLPLGEVAERSEDGEGKP